MNELQLRDIHLPSDSLWWPLAPGWWILMLLIVLSAIAIWILFKRFQKRTLYRSCQKQFRQLKTTIKEGQSNKAAIVEISTFLRRILVSYLGRESTASLTGNEWISAINQLDGSHYFNDSQIHLLAFAQYQQNPDCYIPELLKNTASWVRQLPREIDRAAV